jgi:hypothetical protein
VGRELLGDVSPGTKPIGGPVQERGVHPVPLPVLDRRTDGLAADT